MEVDYIFNIETDLRNERDFEAREFEFLKKEVNKMTRGRFAEKPPSSNVTFSITDATNAKLSLLLHDPVTGRARYGMKSFLVEELIIRFFDSVVQDEDIIKTKDLRLGIKL